MKKEENIINLIFDCDGTLVDSYDAISDRICRVLLRHGISCRQEEARELALRYNVGYSILKIASDNGFKSDTLVSEYGKTQEDLERITLMNNAEKVLNDERFNCFVYTHRGKSTEKIFTRLGIIDCFKEIVDNSYGFRHKPDRQGIDYLVEKYNLDRKKTYYIGDRDIDIKCGVNSGIGTVFLKSSGIDIDCSEADYVISDLEEILNLPL